MRTTLTRLAFVVGVIVSVTACRDTEPLAPTSPEPGAAPAAAVYTDNFVEITAGAYHTCARRRFGTTYCWGRDEYGQLATWCRELTDAAAEGVAGPGRRRMHSAFRASSEHELAFWESAWRS